MFRITRFLQQQLSPRQSAGVLLIVLALGGLGYGIYEFLRARMLEVQIRAAVPNLSAQIRSQRETIVRAIEAYKSSFGIYPPDHVLSRQPLVVDAINNPLLYELAGAVLDPTNHTFAIGRLEAADAQFVTNFFGGRGFRNCGDTTEHVKHFLSPEALPVRQLHDDPDVFALGFFIPYEELAPAVVWEINVSSWRYVSSSPTNNRGRFDLWIELEAKGAILTIGNWKEVE